ncbi:MAG: hypothetical protein ACI4OI_04695 [Gemmiger sp.]
MHKLKTWLRERFLPAWCREDLLAENAALRHRIDRLTAENERLRAYIAGLEYAARRRVTINNYAGRSDAE